MLFQVSAKSGCPRDFSNIFQRSLHGPKIPSAQDVALNQELPHSALPSTKSPGSFYLWSAPLEKVLLPIQFTGCCEQTLSLILHLRSPRSATQTEALQEIKKTKHALVCLWDQHFIPCLLLHYHTPSQGNSRKVLTCKGSCQLIHRPSGLSNNFSLVHHLAYYRMAA